MNKENCQVLLERIGLEKWAIGKTKVSIGFTLCFFSYTLYAETRALLGRPAFMRLVLAKLTCQSGSVLHYLVH